MMDDDQTPGGMPPTPPASNPWDKPADGDEAPAEAAPPAGDEAPPAA